MKHKLRSVLCALIMILTCACSSFGVTVTGHDGTSLALSQIPDIIRHVTGKTSGDLSFKKESLYMYGAFFSANPPNAQKDVYSFNTDGSNNHVASCGDTTDDNLSGPIDYQNLAAITAQTVRDSDNGKLVLNFYPGGDTSALHNQAASVTGNANDGSANIDDGLFYTLRGGNSQVIQGSLVDVKGGMTINGYDGEVTAYLMRNGATISVYLGYVYVGDESWSTYAESAVSGSWSTTITSDVPTMRAPYNTPYIPVSMVVGDFNNDGYKNEIAVAYSDRAAVRYVVLQATQTSNNPDNTDFALNVLNNGDVGSYNYNAYFSDGFSNYIYDRYGGQMDGLTVMYSVATATGDFDGDGQSEFAVVWRDTTPNSETLSLLPVDSLCLFVGYTGKIHVKTYKWNGGGYSTEEDVQAFDAFSRENDTDRGMQWNNLDLPLGVKATAGDFDGDGRDDIAVLRIMLQCSEYSNLNDNSFWYSNFVFGGFVDWYTFNSGSIHPNYRAHSWEPTDPTTVGSQPPNYGVNQNGWVGIRSTGNMSLGRILYIPTDINVDNEKDPGTQNQLRQIYYVQPLTGAQDAYPIIDREFDIIAGKFSGRIGNVDNMIICDDLVIKYPQWSNSDGNKLRSHVALMTNIPGTTNWGTQVNEITSLSDRNHLLAFTKGDYLNESVTLGEPVKTSDTTDEDHIAILQTFPYHVDNLTSDGTALQKEPQNFTLRLGTAVTYQNTSSTTNTKNVTYQMTSKAETIFAFDNKALQTTSKAFQGVRGVLGAVLGNNDLIKKISGVGAIWDKLSDTVQTTKTTSNENSQHYEVQITTAAKYNDTLYMNQSTRYWWRYPVQQYPAPSWLMGSEKDRTITADTSKASKQQSYITFAMSEPAIPTSMIGYNDSHYQPYHELGNLFSYPTSIESTDGYAGSTTLTTGTVKWAGADYHRAISFTSTTTDQEGTKKVNKQGAITKFLSAIDSIFGSDLAQIPADSDSTYSRSVVNGEAVSIDIPATFSTARFNALFNAYLDVAGTTTVVFAIERFYRDDALWGTRSLYSTKPDPSFLLPGKFNIIARADSDWDRPMFVSNDNDPTALQMRGVRFVASDYGMETDNLLVKGLKYTISVPVYNASFVNVKNLVVRLSYATSNTFNAAKTTIGNFTFDELPGWGNGNSRQTATFTWTPDVEDGIYYLFAEIDPDNKIDEVHENRRNPKDSNALNKPLLDSGGNNLGYLRIGVASTNTPTFDRNQLENPELSSAAVNGVVFPYVNWVKADGLDLEDFIKQKVDGASKPVPAEVELDYGGDTLLHKARLVGYTLKPASYGKNVEEVTDDDIGYIFLNERFVFFPGEEHKLHIQINPSYLEDGVGFKLNVHGEEYPLTDIIYGSAGSYVVGVNPSSSGGGCEAFSGLMAGVLALIFAMKARRS